MQGYAPGRTLPIMLNKKFIEDTRQKLGLSQDEAAKRAGFSGKSYWRDIVSGRKANVKLETLSKMAKALGVKPSQLLEE